MGKSLHLEWNQLQLKIAKLLGEKKVAWEVAKELVTCPQYDTTYRVRVTRILISGAGGRITQDCT